MRFSVRHEDYSAQDHIDACSKDGGCHQDKDGLDDVGAPAPIRGLGCGERSCSVAYYFNCLLLACLLAVILLWERRTLESLEHLEAGGD